MQTTRDGGRVAIVGGGPAGLVAANSLLEEGLHSPYLNEAQISADSGTLPDHIAESGKPCEPIRAKLRCASRIFPWKKSCRCFSPINKLTRIF